MKTKWISDPAHSEVQFKVKHLVISTVTGNFDAFEAQLETDSEDFVPANISFEAKTASVNTNNSDRDNHLRSADFFDVENFPTLNFKSASFSKTSESAYELAGELSIKGISRNVLLNVEFGGRMTDPYGNEKAGFEISGKINRKDFNLTWNAVTEAGGVVVSDEVRLLINIQLVKEK